MSALDKIALGEIMALKIGSVDPSKFHDEVFDLYSIPAFDSGKPEIIDGSKIGSAKQIVQPGDVLLSKIVPHIRRSWIVGENQGRRLIGSGEWIVFRSKKVHPEYLRHVLVADPFHVQFMSTVSGVGGSLLRARPAQVAGIEIPLPPLDEQRRIAAILDKADAIRRKRQESIRLTEEFLRSTFLEMFGDIPAKKSKYEFGTIRGLVSAQSGKSSGPVLATDDTGIPIYGGNGVNGWATKALFEEKVVVVGRVGQQCGIVHITEGPAWVTDNAIVIKVTDPTKLHPIYVAEALQRSPLRKAVEQLDLPFINQSTILDYPIPMPPLSDQMQFLKIRNAVLKTRLHHGNGSIAIQELFNSLTQRAFRGELSLQAQTESH